MKLDFLRTCKPLPSTSYCNKRQLLSVSSAIPSSHLHFPLWPISLHIQAQILSRSVYSCFNHNWNLRQICKYSLYPTDFNSYNILWKWGPCKRIYRWVHETASHLEILMWTPVSWHWAPNSHPSQPVPPGNLLRMGWGLHSSQTSALIPVANGAGKAAGNFQPMAGREEPKPVQLSHAELECDAPTRHGWGGWDIPRLNPLPRIATVCKIKWSTLDREIQLDFLWRSCPCMALKPNRSVA